MDVSRFVGNDGVRLAFREATPTLVVIGDQDERSDADELAALLPAGRYVRVPGGHGTFSPATDTRIDTKGISTVRYG
jgi:pimeloyl-ACP methyl ester carboxylesterase